MSVTDAVSAYGEAVRHERRLRDARDFAQADAKRLSAELAEAAERRHSLRVRLNDTLGEEDD
jgi:hypothetical protein